MEEDGILEVKMEQDLSGLADVQIPESEKIFQERGLQDALSLLLALEKQTRTAADLASSSRVLVQIVKLCFQAKEWKIMQENIVLLSKKRAQLKQAVTKMIQEAMTYLNQTPDKETKLELIETLRTVTEGKIYVEVERARLTRILSNIKEEEGKVIEAADILQEVQVETYGSMEKREKTDFILEQMRLCLAKKDYIRTQIISRKISTKYFKEEGVQDLKLRFYGLMIQHSLHDNQYLSACKYYLEIYNTKMIQDDEKMWNEVLRNIVIFVILAPYDNEQSDLINRIYLDKNLLKLPLYREVLKKFITEELLNWTQFEQTYGAELLSNLVFASQQKGGDESGEKRWPDLRKRVVEHNIRVIAQYYTRITNNRLNQLLDLSAKETEEFLSNLVVAKTISAKIDRPAGVVTFTSRKDASDTLNDWSSNIKSLLSLIERTTHLIAKEEMVHKIAK